MKDANSMHKQNLQMFTLISLGRGDGGGGGGEREGEIH
jgi:hypothetical protein